MLHVKKPGYAPAVGTTGLTDLICTSTFFYRFNSPAKYLGNHDRMAVDSVEDP